MLNNQYFLSAIGINIVEMVCLNIQSFLEN